jgi:signal transduction histidine kinase
MTSHFGKEIPLTQGSEGELRQVFLTIIVNALDTMKDQGTLTIETGAVENMFFAKISDTGPATPSGLIDRIFDSLFTTKSERGGTGLGLSIADNIIKGYDGSIEVTSEEGKGATC